MCLQKGKNKFEDLDFSIESSSLRVILQGNEDDNPKLDFSNLSDFLPAAFVHVKVKNNFYFWMCMYLL